MMFVEGVGLIIGLLICKGTAQQFPIVSAGCWQQHVGLTVNRLCLWLAIGALKHMQHSATDEAGYTSM